MTMGFPDGVSRNREGGRFAFATVCSAHPDSLAASLRFARRHFAVSKVGPALIHARIEAALKPYLEVSA